MHLSVWFAFLGVVAFCHAARQREMSFVNVNGDGSDGEPEDKNAICMDPCKEKFEEVQSQQDCFEGCRLALIYRYFDIAPPTEEGIVEKCGKGCVKSYESVGKDSIERCSDGCAIKVEPKANGVLRLEINDTAKTFEVANSLINDPFAGFRKIFGSGVFDLPRERPTPKSKQALEQQSAENESFDPVVDFFKQFEIQRKEMEETFLKSLSTADQQEIQDDLRDFSNKVHGIDVNSFRPAGHELASFNGRSVDNMDEFGRAIIHSNGVDEDLSHAEFQQRVRETEELAIRNERLIQIGHYGVKLILAVLFIVILLLALAMVRHHTSMTYQHLRERAFFANVDGGALPKTAEALPQKDASENIYSTAPVHGSPPPAYDQLSIKKVQQQ